MNLKRNLGTTVSMLFLLGLTILAAGVYFVANGAEQKIGNDANQSALSGLL